METTGIRVEQVERKSWILSGIFVILSLPFLSLAVSAGVALGSLLAILNFRWLRFFGARLLSGSRLRLGGFLPVMYFLKYAGVAAILFLALKYGLASGFGIVAGVSVIILAIFWEAAASHRQIKEGADRAA